MNLFNSISDELLITIQSCTILICLYAIILFMLFRTKNKLNKQRYLLAEFDALKDIYSFQNL